MTKGGDFASDVARGSVMLVEATANPTEALSVPVVREASVTHAASALEGLLKGDTDDKYE
jgi:hypothetical protein